MSKKANQWFELTKEQLFTLCGSRAFPGAEAAAERVAEIESLGHKPAIYYSQFSQFRITDEDDPEQYRVSLAIAGSAKPFSM